VTAREAALRIAALYGWAPTTDPQQMGSIPEKSNWDVVEMVATIVERYGCDAVCYTMECNRRALCECCAGGIASVQDPRGRWTHWVAGARVPCRADVLQGKDALAAPRTALAEHACCCNGAGKCGYCAEEAVCRAEAIGDAREECGL
jgi:hypothetical protein